MPLNFYELYNLINEDTVSQSLKNRKDKESLKRLIKECVSLAKTRLNNIGDKSLESLAKFVISYELKLKWRDPNQNIGDLSDFKYDLNNPNHYRDIRSVFSNIINGGEVYNDYLSAMAMNNNGEFPDFLLSKFNNPNFSYQDLSYLAEEYHRELKEKKRR
jgi:hypothetical protein